MQTKINKENNHHRRGWSELDVRYRWSIILLVLTLIGGMGWSSFYHYTQFVSADSARIAALSQTQRQQKTIDELTAREKDLIAMDSRRSQELAYARAVIQRLQSNDLPDKSHF